MALKWSMSKSSTQTGFAVKNYTETMRALRYAEKDSRLQVRKQFRKVGDIVKETPAGRRGPGGAAANRGSTAAQRGTTGRAAGIGDLITVDIGGTSCDIALISRGQPLIRAEGEISGYSVRVPMVDVNAIGAGGGSIAWIDGAGSLRVGPHSAASAAQPA